MTALDFQDGKVVVYVVCTGHGYYPDSIWSSRELALAEADRLLEKGLLGRDERGQEDRLVQRWLLDAPEQHFAESRAT